jgi:hypothetical protein
MVFGLISFFVVRLIFGHFSDVQFLSQIAVYLLGLNLYQFYRKILSDSIKRKPTLSELKCIGYGCFEIHHLPSLQL